MNRNLNDFINKRFGKRKLWNLRKQIVLDSLFVSDYQNRYGLDTHSMCMFFDGYFGYLCELIRDKYDKVTNDRICEFDNADNLKCWYDMCDDLSWVSSSK